VRGHGVAAALRHGFDSTRLSGFEGVPNERKNERTRNQFAIKHRVHFHRQDFQNVAFVKENPTPVPQAWAYYAMGIDSSNEVMTLETTLNYRPVPNALLWIKHFEP
jgi:hypothetical protein